MSTQGVAPGGSPEGTNPRRLPQVIDYYNDNIPRGTNFRFEQYWRTATPPQSAKIQTVNAGPYEFSRGYNDVLELSINYGSIETLIFGTHAAYTANQVRDDILAKWGTSLDCEIDGIGRITLISKLSGALSSIRVVAGSANPVFGWANETVVKGVDQITGVSPRILDNPQQDNYNATTRYYKRIVFMASEDFSMGTNAIWLNSKAINRFIGGFSSQNTLQQLLAACDSNTVRELTINGSKWYSGEYVFEVPLKVNSSNADYFILDLTDKDQNSINTGLNAGELYITVKGWSAYSALV